MQSLQACLQLPQRRQITERQVDWVSAIGNAASKNLLTKKIKPNRTNMKSIRKSITKSKYLYLMSIPVILYFFIFAYLPMYGVVIAFQQYSPGKGIFGSTFIGLKNFTDFFNSYYFWRLLGNTVLISLYDLIFSFPAPIILALLMNEVKNRTFKRTIQTITYMPYFISLVVVAGIMIDFCLPTGFISDILVNFGVARTNLLGKPEFFRTIYVASNIWQSIGFSSIIYLAAITAIDQEQYEAAVIDGAGRLRQTWHITLPAISTTIIILLILRIGNLLNVGFEKIILIYSPITYEVGDVISSFVYRKGLLESNYGYSAAVGLFNSIINFVLLIMANQLSRTFTKSSLW
jgi:putative aldouronate transport system permease protein